MEDWTEEDEHQKLERNALNEKLDALYYKSMNSLKHTRYKSVRFKTLVKIHVVSRHPKDIWYSGRELMAMR